MSEIGGMNLLPGGTDCSSLAVEGTSVLSEASLILLVFALEDFVCCFLSVCLQSTEHSWNALLV